MRKYLEAGVLSFICCVVLGFVLAMGKTPAPTTTEAPTAPPAKTQAAALTPKVPAFVLSKTLPILTPEETRFPIPSQYQASSADFADGIGDDTWDSDLDWGSFDYVAPEDNQFRVEIDPSNYGDRYVKDAKGKVVQNDILVVLHETTSSAESALHTFLTHHPNDANQVSYHALILIDGRIVHLVPPENRAYGAGNSEFRTDKGVESVQTNPKYPSSVNNFAYHISLETPLDAQNKAVEAHSGYSLEQYESLAWLIQELDVPASRVTTHRAVDRAQDRSDPRSFDMSYLASLLF